MHLHPLHAEQLARDRVRTLRAQAAVATAHTPLRLPRRAARAVVPRLRFRLAGLPLPPSAKGC